MKGKSLIAAAGLLLVVGSAHAEMQAMDDAALSNVTGQALELTIGLQRPMLDIDVALTGDPATNWVPRLSVEADVRSPIYIRR